MSLLHVAILTMSLSASGIIDKIGIQKFSEAINKSTSHVRVMKARNSIPPKYWMAVADQAKKQKIRITYKIIAQAHDVRAPA